MKNLEGKLPLIAFVVAAFAAVAFSPAKELPQDLYGEDPVQGWVNINDMPPGARYECNDSGECLYDTPNGTPLTEGTFQYIPPVEE